MRNAGLAAVLTAVALWGCGPQLSDTMPTPQAETPQFEGGGQLPQIADSAPYPGPYGVGVGSVIPNYQFYGYPRFMTGTPLAIVKLSDFYNPTGDGVYPAGSPFGEGTPKPKAIVMDRSAVWCVPCQNEARYTIPEHRGQSWPKGEFFVSLDDGPDPGTPATKEDLEGWTSRFSIDYPAVIDPNSTLGGIVGYDAYPGNVIVRTRDMKIVEWTTSAGGAAFWDKFQKVIDDQPVLPGE